MPKKAAWPRLTWPQKPVMTLRDSAKENGDGHGGEQGNLVSHTLPPRQEALGPDHQHQDEEGEGDGVPVQQVAHIDGAEGLDHAQGQGGHQGAAHGAQSRPDTMIASAL